MLSIVTFFSNCSFMKHKNKQNNLLNSLEDFSEIFQRLKGKLSIKLTYWSEFQRWNRNSCFTYSPRYRKHNRMTQTSWMNPRKPLKYSFKNSLFQFKWWYVSVTSISAQWKIGGSSFLGLRSASDTFTVHVAYGGGLLHK